MVLTKYNYAVLIVV